MKHKKHKRKKNHVIIVTSDAVDARTHQMRIRSWLLWLLIIIVSVGAGGMVGYIYHTSEPQEAIIVEETNNEEIIKELEEQKKELQTEVEELNEQVAVLNETILQKTQSENELSAQLEQQSTPTEFPLTGSATMEEVGGEEPICIFTASVGITVVATASGTVTAITEDAEYGNNVWVDHGNGYVTVYRNMGNVNVRTGDEVAKGTTIFMIGEDNTKFGYQMMKNDTYINPMDMLTING